ncbi:N-acetyltransferase family protein [Streptomyces sp. NBC_01314]|uniref:GNAT family N-acetyltransferase n=1 Tax=Streptomyces sp. NBC_01314 TaxID=2903821 RepID=UPI0030915136|nr:GNAT family N-acetyltransferase [Streptomyces sp. NBC_01314]
MPVPHIRAATADDEDTLGRLDRDSWSTLHSVQDRPTQPYQPFFDERHAPHDHLVAELGGTVVGYVRLALSSDLACHKHVGQIQGLVVAERARGAGVARALLRAVQDEARHRGARRLTLRVLGHNTAARKLYESEGFAVEGILPEEFLLDGAYVDDVLMGRRL